MNEPIAKIQFRDVFSGIVWALKYAIAVSLATLLVLSDRQDVPGRMTDEMILRPDRAIAWGFTVLVVLAVARALFLSGNRAENEKLHFAIKSNKQTATDIAPIEPSIRIGKRMVDEEFVGEFKNVERYEVRRTRAANFAMISFRKNQGPLRVQAGQIAYNVPEVWRSTGSGVLVVSNYRMIWLGSNRRQEWRWNIVGDVIPDRNGLLVFGRSGRPVGLKMQPNPKIFAYIEQQLGV